MLHAPQISNLDKKKAKQWYIQNNNEYGKTKHFTSCLQLASTFSAHNRFCKKKFYHAAKTFCQGQKVWCRKCITLYDLTFLFLNLLNVAVDRGVGCLYRGKRIMLCWTFSLYLLSVHFHKNHDLIIVSSKLGQ